MLHLRPEAVMMDRAVDDHAPTHPAYDLVPPPPSFIAPSGTLWKATQATAEKGRLVWRRWSEPSSARFKPPYRAYDCGRTRRGGVHKPDPASAPRGRRVCCNSASGPRGMLGDPRNPNVAERRRRGAPPNGRETTICWQPGASSIALHSYDGFSVRGTGPIDSHRRLW